jgi:hypothetical protein
MAEKGKEYCNRFQIARGSWFCAINPSPILNPKILLSVESV